MQTPSTPSSASVPLAIPGTRMAWVRTLSVGCKSADLELILSLRAAKSEYLDLAYPGPLSMPLVAWRCGDAEWTAVIPTKPMETPAGLLVPGRSRDAADRSAAHPHAAHSWCPRTLRSARARWRPLAWDPRLLSACHRKHPPVSRRRITATRCRARWIWFHGGASPRLPSRIATAPRWLAARGIDGSVMCASSAATTVRGGRTRSRAVGQPHARSAAAISRRVTSDLIVACFNRFSCSSARRRMVASHVSRSPAPRSGA